MNDVAQTRLTSLLKTDESYIAASGVRVQPLQEIQIYSVSNSVLFPILGRETHGPISTLMFSYSSTSGTVDTVISCISFSQNETLCMYLENVPEWWLRSMGTPVGGFTVPRTLHDLIHQGEKWSTLWRANIYFALGEGVGPFCKLVPISDYNYGS